MRKRARSLRPRFLVASLLAAVGACDREPAAAPTPVPDDRVLLYSPWHRADRPGPFPADEQWYWRDLWSAPPPGTAEPPFDAQAADALQRGLETAAARGPLGGEAALAELLPLTERALRALDHALDHEDRDVRYLAARLLLRRMRDTPAGQEDALAALAARHLRDDADEVSLLHLETLASTPRAWPVLRLIKTFGKFDNHLLVTVRARAGLHLARRGNFSGVPLFLKILKENTRLQDDANRDWDVSLQTAWWKEEALLGLEACGVPTFGFSPDATEPAQTAAIEKIEAWWNDHKVEVWSRAAPLEDPELVRRVQQAILGLGTFQLRNVDNATFALTALGPPVAPLLLEAAEGSSLLIRHHCLEILAELMALASPQRRREWFPSLTRQLGDADEGVRCRALGALGSSQLSDAIPHLRRALEGENLALAEVALYQLSRFPGPEARKLLISYAEGLSSESPLWVPGLAARIAAGDGSCVDTFLALLEKPGPTAARAQTYLAWMVAEDSISAARTAEERARALDELRTALRARADQGD